MELSNSRCNVTIHLWFSTFDIKIIDIKIIQSWKANSNVNLIVYNSPLDNPSTDYIIAIDDYVCGYACKDSKPAGATAYLFKNMVNAVDADKVTGKSLSAKMLIALTIGFCLLHWPRWFDIQEVKGDAESWIDRFVDFLSTDECNHRFTV